MQHMNDRKSIFTWLYYGSGLPLAAVTSISMTLYQPILLYIPTINDGLNVQAIAV